MTTEAQRQKAAAIVAEMSALPGIESAQVDDWDDFGGFNFFVRLKPAQPGSRMIKFLIPLQGIILRIKASAVWQWHQAPRRPYGWAGCGRRKYWNASIHGGINLCVCM